MQKRQLPARAWVMIIILAIFGTGFVGLFAWQTWGFVNWLLPADNWLMKILAVLNFDVMSLVWLLCDLFLPLEWNSKVTAAIAGGIDFILSTVATVMELTVVAAVRFNTNIPSPVIYSCYGVIAFALVVNLIAFILIVRIQWPHIIGEQNVYSSANIAPDYSISSTNNTNKTEITSILPTNKIEEPTYTKDEVLALLARERRRATQELPTVVAPNNTNNGAYQHPLVVGAKRIKKAMPPLRKEKAVLAQVAENTGTK